MKALVSWLLREMMRVLPAIIYFCITLNLIYFTAGLALRAGEPRYFSYSTITLCSLIIGKILLIMNAFSFINAFPNKPIIYNIVWKFFIYSLAVLAVWVLHNYLHTYFHFSSSYVAEEKLIKEFKSDLFWSSFITLMLVFLGYIVFSELTRRLGRKTILEIFFGSHRR